MTPLLARIYPNGLADVNQFEAAGGMPFVIGQLLDQGLAHADVLTVAGEGGLERYRLRPRLAGESVVWEPGVSASGDTSIVRPAGEAFAPEGGLKLLQGNLGRGVIKISAVKSQHRLIEAPAAIFRGQDEMLAAFKAGELERDLVAVVRFQGPQANGMPELHKLTPSLGVLQDKGFKVALVTDGRMSGASGKVPAAIHLTPEAADGGPLARLRDGDIVRLDAEAGTLEALVDPATGLRAPRSRPIFPATIMASAATCSPGCGAASAVPKPARRCSATSPPEETDMSYTPNSYSRRVAEVIDEAVVIPVLTLHSVESGVALARALARGGLTVLEITLRTEVALAAIAAIAEALPEVTVGSGTCLTRDHLQASLDHGCRFAVSPGATPALLDAAEAVGLPLLPAAATAGQAMMLAERGYLRQKLFPAEPSGGVPLLKSLGDPLPQIRFCPTGGIDLAKAPTYLALANVVCVGGSWVAPKAAIEAGDWARIEQLAAEAVALKRRA